MRTGVYLCECGSIVTERLDFDALAEEATEAGASYVRRVELGCSEEGWRWIAEDLRAERPDRVVVAACSPREHEETFRRAMEEAGLNPFLMQLVNVREHAAWVTNGSGAATGKAAALLRGALSRMAAMEPLERSYLEVSPDVMVVGAGPAGLKAALALAGAGRRAVLVEKSPILGGMAVRYEEVFPSMECGPCLLEPLVASALHGPLSENIEVLTCSEVAGAKGSFGNFSVRVRLNPRYVDTALCVGCGACVAACPVSSPNPFNCGMGERKAVDFVFFGGLPSVPYIDPVACTRLSGRDGCSACVDACPVQGAVNLGDSPRVEERTVGAVILAVGAQTYGAEKLPELGGNTPGVYTWVEAERMFATTGPSGGVPARPDGTPLRRIAFIHCAGSLDEAHRDYCSGVCCLGAFKLSHLATHRLEGAELVHYYRTLVMSGKTEVALYRKVAGRARFVNYGGPGGVGVAQGPGGPVVTCGGEAEEFDLVVLMTPLVPPRSASALAAHLNAPLDATGFFEELGARVDPSSTRIRGVYLAGACRTPVDLSQAAAGGLAAAGAVMAELLPGGVVELEVSVAVVDEGKCSGCRTCAGVCPYGAISFGAETGRAAVNPALCVGCGTCAVACPAAAITARNFTDGQIFAELEGLLR